MLFMALVDMMCRSLAYLRSGAVMLPLQTDFISDDPFGEARDGIAGIYGSLKGLLEVVLVLAAMFIIVRIVLKLMSGDRDSAKHLLWWVVGLAFGFVMLEVLALLISESFVSYGPFL